MNLIDGVTIAAAVFVVLVATAAFMGFGPRQVRLLLPALAGVLGVVVVLQMVAIPFAATASTTASESTTSAAAVSSTEETSTNPPAPTSEPPPTDKATGARQEPTVEDFLATSETPLLNPPKAPACGTPTKWTFDLAKAYAHVKAQVSIEGGEPDPNDKVRIDATRTPTDWDPRKTLLANTGGLIDLPVDGAEQLVLTTTPISNCSGKSVVWTFTV